MTEPDTLEITDYEHGYLMAKAEQFHQELVNDGDIDDEWCGAKVGDRQFDINIWYEEETDQTHCTIYFVDSDTWLTDTSLYRRIW